MKRINEISQNHVSCFVRSICLPQNTLIGLHVKPVWLDMHVLHVFHFVFRAEIHSSDFLRLAIHKLLFSANSNVRYT